MSRKNRLRLQVEEFESRLTPAVTRSIGTLQVRDLTARYDWVSGAANISGTVIGTDTLGASLDVTYALSGSELAQATTADGLVLDNEMVRWVNNGNKKQVEILSEREYKVTLKAAAGATAFSKTVIILFPTTIKNDDHKDNQNTVWHQAWLKDNPVQWTFRIDLTSVAPTPGNAGGRNPGVPLRQTSPEVSSTDVGLLSSPDLPAPGPAGYRLLTFNSANGTDFTFSAANSTGYGLFAASSPNLVEDANENWILDPSTTLSPVFLDGSPTAGAYNGFNNDLVLRANSGGQPLLLTGHTYSAVPAALSSLADGQTVTVPASDIQGGSDMLWLDYDDGNATHGFVLVPTTSSQPQITVTDTTVTEGGGGGGGGGGTGSASVTISLSAAAASAVTVDWSTVGGTATEGSDFTGTSGTVTFLPGETSKTIAVPIIGDTTFEPNEDFFVTLSSATNAVIADDVGMVTILNDDAQPTVGISNVIQQQEEDGSTILLFTVSLSNASWQPVNVDFGTSDGTAVAGTDYDATSGTLTFQPGQTTQTVAVTVHPDASGGGDKWFDLDLSNAVNAHILFSQTMGVISVTVGTG